MELLHSFFSAVDALLGLGKSSFELGLIQMGLRAVIVFVFAITVVRLGKKRFMGENTAFDLILAIILGSVLSRAITGQAPFFPTLLAGAVLVFMHWVLSVVAFRFSNIGAIFKGHPRTLIRDGEIQWDAMKRSLVTEHDLLFALRMRGQVTDPSDVHLARLERSGDISVIPKKT